MPWTSTGWSGRVTRAIRCARTCARCRCSLVIVSKLIGDHFPLPSKEINHRTEQDDQKDHHGNRRAHGLVRELKLDAKEGAVEERAEQIGAEVWRALRPLH